LPSEEDEKRGRNEPVADAGGATRAAIRARDGALALVQGAVLGRAQARDLREN
jgi:hypothetical protein